MAGISDKELRHFDGWKGGLDNVSEEAQLTDDKLRVAENVDLDKFGKPSRRQGYTLVRATTAGRSLYGHAGLPFLLFTDGTTMYGIREDGSVFTVKTGLAPLRDTSYATVNGLTYFSNGHDKGCVTSAGVFREWGCETPHGQPILTPSGAGGLAAGNYQIAFTFLSLYGEESGAYLGAPVDITQGAGITVSSIPQPVSGEVVAVRLYATPFDGDVLYWVRDLPVGMTSTTVGAFNKGKMLETQFLGPLPPGQFVCYVNGRIFVAAGSVLFWSEALRYGLTNLAHGNLPFDANIDMVGPSESGEEPGIFVAAGDRTYYLPSGKDAKPSEIRVAYPHGVVRGTALVVPGSPFGQGSEPVLYWVASNGVSCIGKQDGTVVPLRERQAVAPLATSGASMYREQNGNRQVVTALRGPAGQNFGMTDTAVATVYRNGVVI